VEEDVQHDPEPPAEREQRPTGHEVAEPDVPLRVERWDRRALPEIGHVTASQGRGIGVAVWEPDALAGCGRVGTVSSRPKPTGALASDPGKTGWLRYHAGASDPVQATRPPVRTNVMSLYSIANILKRE